MKKFAALLIVLFLALAAPAFAAWEDQPSIPARTTPTIAVLSDSIGWSMNATVPISALTQAGGVATATSTSHNLAPGELIFVVWCGTGYDGWRTVATVADANTFTFACSTSAAATASLIAQSEAAVMRRRLATNWISWASSALGGGLRWAERGANGVGGATSAQILSRTQDVIDSGAKYCVVISGHNDLIAVTGDPSAAFANVRDTWLALQAAGITPIASTCELDSGFASTDATKRKTILALNELIKSYCYEHNILLMDLRALYADPASADGLSKTTVHQADHLHPNILGAEVIGEEVARLLAGRFEPVSYLPDSQLVDSAREFVANPLMTGSGGGVSGCTGTPPTGMNALMWSGTGTWVASSEARTVADDGDAVGYNAVLQTSASSDADALELGTVDLSSAVIAADASKIQGVCHLQVEGMAAIASLSVGILYTVDGVERTCAAMEGWLLNAGAPDVSIRLETPVLTLPSGTLSSLRFMARVAGMTGGGAVVVKLGRVQVRKVE